LILEAVTKQEKVRIGLYRRTSKKASGSSKGSRRASISYNAAPLRLDLPHRDGEGKDGRKISDDSFELQPNHVKNLAEKLSTTLPLQPKSNSFLQLRPSTTSALDYVLEPIADPKSADKKSGNLKNVLTILVKIETKAGTVRTTKRSIEHRKSTSKSSSDLGIFKKMFGSPTKSMIIPKEEEKTVSNPLFQVLIMLQFPTFRNQVHPHENLSNFQRRKRKSKRNLYQNLP